VLIHWPSSALADVFYDYTFSGDGGLSGSFSLDTSVPFTGPGIYLQNPVLGFWDLITPLSTLTGSYGAFSFSGSTNLDIILCIDTVTAECAVDSQWIVRAGTHSGYPISSNSVGGRSVTGLDLFDTFIGGPLLVPPVPYPEPNIFNFSYGIDFSDGTSTSAQLDTLELVGTHTVPEPSTLALVGFGLLAIPLLRCFPIQWS
jgi:hypothetical protein